MRIVIRTSKWAIWSRRLASLALPLIVIPVIAHRQRLLDTDAFHVAAVVALGVTLMALFAALVAVVRLWHTGDRGWDRAVPALFLALVCLVPFAWAAWQVRQYPAVNDVATAERYLLPLVLDSATAAMRPPAPLASAGIDAFFPNARTRTYPLNAEQTFQLAERLAERRGWRIAAHRPPAGPEGDGLLNARLTALFGWQDEVVLRIAGGPDGAGVDMRSVSLDALHDLGANGNRIEAFLNDLDAEITDLVRNNPNITEPVPPNEFEADPPPEADS